MIKMTGRGWAYAGLLVGLSASITANVASTVLSESTVSLFLRVPFAVIWPVLTYIAIEVLTRTDWERSFSHILIRVVISVPVAAVAAFVSYLHQHELMVLGDEPGLAQLVGPLAIDGMLFGMTATLIVTRVSGTQRQMMLLQYDRPIGPMPSTQPMLQVEEPQPLQDWSTAELDPIPVSPAPVRDWNAREVAELAVDGKKAREIHEKLGVSMATAGRFTKVARMLQADPRADIDPAREKLHADHIKMMRELVSR